MSRIRYNQNTKDANMTLRCTKEEKERIVKKAKQNGKCIGAYSARTAHPFQRNGAPFRFKLSKAQQVY